MHRITIVVDADCSNLGFGNCDGMTDLELLRWLSKEEGFFGVLEIDSDVFADGIKSVEEIAATQTPKITIL